MQFSLKIQLELRDHLVWLCYLVASGGSQSTGERSDSAFLPDCQRTRDQISDLCSSHGRQGRICQSKLMCDVAAHFSSQEDRPRWFKVGNQILLSCVDVILSIHQSIFFCLSGPARGGTLSWECQTLLSLSTERYNLSSMSGIWPGASSQWDMPETPQLGGAYEASLWDAWTTSIGSFWCGGATTF